MCLVAPASAQRAAGDATVAEQYLLSAANQERALLGLSQLHRDPQLALDPAIDAAGISVIERGGELYAVEDFAKTVRSVSLAQQESAIASLLAQPGRMAVDLSPGTTSVARQTCAMSTGYAGERKPWFVMRFTSDSLAALPGELKTRIASGRFHEAAVGACADPAKGPFTSYNIAVLLYP